MIGLYAVISEITKGKLFKLPSYSMNKSLNQQNL